MQVDKTHYRPDIEGLRAIAIFGVLGFHALPEFVPGGFVGVDVFFVISGYLITGIIFNNISTKSFSFFDFFFRRVRRIFPALAVVLLSTLLLGWFLLLPDEYSALGKHTIAATIFSSNFLLLDEINYFNSAAELKPLLHLWSLGVEGQFYLVWPVLLIGIWRFSKYGAQIFFILILFSFLLNIFYIEVYPAKSFYLPITRFWELLMGAFVAVSIKHQNFFSSFFLWLEKLPSPRLDILRNISSVSGFLLILLAIIFINKNVAFPGIAALIPTLGTVMIIAAGPSAHLNRYLLSHPFSVFIGLISYPLYLWHWPLLVISGLSFSLNLFVKILVLVISFFLAWLTYVLIEKPFHILKYRIQKFTALILVFLITGVLGAIVFKNNGYSERYPENVLAISEFDFDHQTAFRQEECELPQHLNPNTFPYCVDQPNESSEGEIILWGDSHAQHLYPGIKSVFGQSNKITMLIAPACPPIIEHSAYKNCKLFNAYSLKRIISEKPDMVIIAGNWKGYDWKLIESTLEKIKSADIKQIDIVGPVPNWLPTLKRNLINYLRFNNIEGELPKRLDSVIDPRASAIDKEMEVFFEKQKVNYISPWKIFCNDQGCLTYIDSGIESMVTFDYGHLTTKASKFLVSRFPD